jgi:hypothetical protein
MSLRTDTTTLLTDVMALQESIICLEPEHFDYAIQISQKATTEACQWHTYLNGLAFCGFTQWLERQATNLLIQQDLCTILQPQYASLLDAVCHLNVGSFTLCLLVTESIVSEQVRVPRAVVDLPEFTAHFYVLIEVQEEQAQIVLRGCLRYDQLVQLRQINPLPVQPNWTYTLPLDWFDASSNHLLFYLRFLEPIALTLPTITSEQQLQRSLGRAALADIWSSLENYSELSQVLTWEQGTALLTSPPLLNWLYLLQTRSQQATTTDNLVSGSNLSQANAIIQGATKTLAQLNQRVVNVWNWAQDRLDETTQTFLESLPQPLTPATAMRRSAEKVEAALHNLKQQGIEIPPEARYAYVNLNSTPFQLCALTWFIPSDRVISPSTLESQWALLFMLVAQPGTLLPVGTKLQVSTTTVLAEVALEASELYLYVLVEGNQNEAFTATILPVNELPITSPTFVCHPDQT